MAIIAVVGDKGGIGKTTLALEIAAALGAVLVDLDWSGGGATRAWGCPMTDERVSNKLFTSRNGRPPKPLRALYRPDLLPGHPKLESISKADAQAKLPLWAAELGRDLVIDTHPGMNALTEAALKVADLAVVPVVLRERELNALEHVLEGGLADRAVLLVPNMVPLLTPRAQYERLKRLVKPFEGLPVSPVVHMHPWWPRRQRRAALVLEPKPGEQVRKARAELMRVAEAVKRCLPDG